MRVYFDASVIIASLLSPTGGSSQLFKYIKAGKIKGIISQTVIEEVLQNDKPEKLKRSKKEIEDFLADSQLLISEYITLEDIEPYKGTIDPKDAHIVAGANLTRCDYLVTLDKKHLLRKDIQEKFKPLRILSPKELLEEIIKTV